MFLVSAQLPGRVDARARIVLVEDHQDTRQMYAEFLGNSFEVEEAGDGQQALDVIRARRPDLVITDLSLPRIDGLELILALRKDPETWTVPIICLSGYGGHVHERQAAEAGCNLMLQKPCMPDELAAAATELLRDSENRSMKS
jgi:DNA-binding response OmpR family regulator